MGKRFYLRKTAVCITILAVFHLCVMRGKDPLNVISPEVPMMVTAGCTMREANTAVLIEEAVLTDCYSYTLTSDNTYIWSKGEEGFELKLEKGDILCVFEEIHGISRVVVPYGDIPWIYGHISSDLLSTEPNDISDGRQAILWNAEAFDAPEGDSIGYTAARVKILSHDGEWVHVMEYGTGAEPYWVHFDELSFKFDGIIPDRP